MDNNSRINHSMHMFPDYRLSVFFLLIFLLISCAKESVPVKLSKPAGYDVILVMGQSNTHCGIAFDSVLDASNSRIMQLGRFGDTNMKIVLATEPLDHHTKYALNIGFAMTFAKEYVKSYLKPDRKVLIIPAGKAGSGLQSNHWKVGDTLFVDAVMRSNFVMDSLNCRMIAMLWHQGESDVGNPDYARDIDSMIVHFRKDIHGAGEAPFILGGMVPYWVQQDTFRISLNKVIAATVNRLPRIGYADPTFPFVILKPDNNYYDVHFDAAGMREMGRRYFDEFVRISNSK